jgi:hypothetical protein
MIRIVHFKDQNAAALNFMCYTDADLHFHNAHR